MANFDVKKYYDDLAKLFKSGPLIRHRIASKIAAPGEIGVPVGTARAFLKHVNNSYTSALASYGQYSRLARYSDYNEMESMPEISSALNLYAEEICSGGEHEQILKINSSNARIKEALTVLFEDVLNLDFNARNWVRNFCKYGDQFMLIDHHPDYGVLNVFPMPVNEVEREEGYDKENPTAYRYRWITQGNRILENWQVIHFRLWGNDNFLPYGSSILEPARRVWRQLILMEDAVMVYRIVRSPERRVFYIGVGNVAPTDIPAFVEKAKTQLKRNQIVDSGTGRVDLRYNPMCNSLKTLIFLQDGRVETLGNIIKEWDDGKKNQWVYSIDRENNKLVPGKVIWAGITRKDAQMVRVHLDNEAYVDVTPDHKMMLRNKEYVEAKDLKAGDSLMPLYKTWTTKEDGHKIVGYEKSYDPFTQYYELTHRNNVISTKGFDEIKGKVVHHIDFDKNNNNPDNLRAMTWKDHCQLHGSSILQYNQSKKGKENSKNNLSSLWQTGKIKSEMFVEMWNNPEIRTKRIERLTLKIDDNFLNHCLRILDIYGNGLSTKESYFRAQLNNDVEFCSYLKNLNKSFKNGFSDKITKTQLQKILKSLGFANAFTELKRFWLFKKTNIKEIINFCEKNNNLVSRKDVLKKFSLSRQDLKEIIELSGWQYSNFSNVYFLNAAKYKKKEYKNHKVVSVEFLSNKEDTGCITVEKYHNFATAGSVDCWSDNEKIDTGVFVRNSTDEDYFIPTRGEGDGTKIETLPGGQFTGDIDDLVYIQNKLFAALKVPKSYLGYEGDINAKSTLSQEDVRFARTIRHIQKMFIAELNKIAVIHLYSMGFNGEDITNFELTMANPSSISELQKLELWRTRFEVASLAQEGMFDRYFVYSKLFGLSDEEIAGIEEGKRKDRLFDLDIQSIQGAGTPPAAPPAQGGSGQAGAAPNASAPEAGLPPPPGEPSQGASSSEAGLDTAGKDPNKQTAAPNELIKVNTGHNNKSTMPNLHKYAFNLKKTAMDPKRNASELTRAVKAPFGESSDPEEVLFNSRIIQLKKFAEDLSKVEILRTSHNNKTKKIISD